MKITQNALLLLIPALALGGCSKQATPTTPPTTNITDNLPAPEPEPEPEPKPPTRRVGDGAIAVGTFNLQWAHDPSGDASKLAMQYRAQTDEDWKWKVERVAKLLIDEKLDVVALQELGGESEVTDIALKVEELSGVSYDWAFVEGTDRTAGHHVAVLSRFPIVSQRRLDIHMRRHLAVDIEVPSGDVITVVTMHAAGGKYPANEKARTKQARALKRALASTQAAQPIVLLGTVNSPHLPGDSTYRSSSAGTLAGVHTKKADDDCFDSAKFLTGQATTVTGETQDRILACGLEIADVELAGHDAIVRKETDPDDRVWSQIPIEEAPFRDVSDHLVLWAEITLPKAEAADAAGEASAATP